MAKRALEKRNLGAPLLGALLRMPGDEIRERMLAALHDQGFSDLTSAHMAVLRYPGPDGLKPVELATQTGMTKQALNYLLAQLEEGGYLVRRGDPEDKRAKRLVMTEKGFEAGRVMRAEVLRIEKEYTNAYGRKALDELKSHLVDLGRVLDRPD